MGGGVKYLLNLPVNTIGCGYASSLIVAVAVAYS